MPVFRTRYTIYSTSKKHFHRLETGTFLTVKQHGMIGPKKQVRTKLNILISMKINLELFKFNALFLEVSYSECKFVGVCKKICVFVQICKVFAWMSFLLHRGIAG